MATPITYSKTEFKARALELCRLVEGTGQPLVITDHGRPTLELRPCAAPQDALKILRGSVVRFDNPFDPVDQTDWNASL